MTTLGRYLRWFAWTVAYFVLPRPHGFDDYLVRAQRTWPPWFRFRPHVWHNDLGYEWEIWFTDEQCHTETRTITVKAHIGQRSGQIVGLTVWDETLASTEGTCEVAGSDTV